MEEILKCLREDGYYQLSESYIGEDDEKLVQIRFTLYKGNVDVVYVEHDAKLHFPTKYIDYATEKKLFYDYFKNLPKKVRITIMNDLWNKYGELDLMLALNKYSTKQICDYGNYLFKYIFLKGKMLFTDERALDELMDKPIMDKSILVAVIKDMSKKLKGSR